MYIFKSEQLPQWGRCSGLSQEADFRWSAKTSTIPIPTFDFVFPPPVWLIVLGQYRHTATSRQLLQQYLSKLLKYAFDVSKLMQCIPGYLPVGKFWEFSGHLSGVFQSFIKKNQGFIRVLCFFDVSSGVFRAGSVPPVTSETTTINSLRSGTRYTYYNTKCHSIRVFFAVTILFISCWPSSRFDSLHLTCYCSCPLYLPWLLILAFLWRSPHSWSSSKACGDHCPPFSGHELQ